MGGLVDFLSQSIQFLYSVSAGIGIPSYGLAIILFTVVVKAVLFPLTYRQLSSMRKLQELAPKQQEIQKKYKKDPQRAQQEVMKLYQKEGVNPFMGCLPLLIQMPILYALFRALTAFFDPVHHPAYVDMSRASFLWIGSLGTPDPIILPILAGVGTFLQQWVGMNRGAGTGAGDQTQRTMLYIMPIFMAWISRSFPAGLALYWVVFSVVSIAENWIVRRVPMAAKEVAGSK